jgi:hypothetical protein
MNGPPVTEFDPTSVLEQKYIGSRTTRCAWLQEAKSEIVETSVGSSFSVPNQNVVSYVHELFVITYREDKEDNIFHSMIVHQILSQNPEAKYYPTHTFLDWLYSKEKLFMPWHITIDSHMEGVPLSSLVDLLLHLDVISLILTLS